jgi:hypothetical protein
MKSNKLFFNSLCQVNKINPVAGSRIIDGRYKPYLSSIDSQYYQGNDVWDAKCNALTAAIKKFGVDAVREKLKA